MSAGILAALALGAGLAVWLLAPLLRSDAAERERTVAAAGEMQDLRSHHEMALAALKDLEDDRATGKIGAEDHRELEAKLTNQALEIMKRMDALEAGRKEAAAPRLAGTSSDGRS